MSCQTIEEVVERTLEMFAENWKDAKLPSDKQMADAYCHEFIKMCVPSWDYEKCKNKYERLKK